MKMSSTTEIMLKEKVIHNLIFCEQKLLKFGQQMKTGLGEDDYLRQFFKDFNSGWDY